MADHLYRSRPAASSSRLLWLMLGVSLLAHLLLFGLAGPPPAPQPAAIPSARQISIRLQRQPAKIAPIVDRLAEDNHQGAGNTAVPQQLLSRRAPPRPPAAAPEPTAAAARPVPITRPAAGAAGIAPSQPSRQISAGALLAQAGELARDSGDNAAADNGLESGQAGPDMGEAARGYPWARYQADWQLKVERIGNLNYPAEARRLGLHGAVTLEVTIAADGSLRSLRVTRPSGNAILDDAARRIVELSAPFPPFPSSLAGRFPTLRISPKFVFTRDNLLSSH
jgi:protein TonB